MTGTPIRVAIVGGGIIGRHHAAAMSRLPRLRVDAAVDPVPEAREALARKAKAAGQYETLTAALADRELDLVVICTPSGMHADAAEEALAAGTHLVVEKPLDVSLERARKLAELAAQAEQRGQMCSVISQHRFDPASVAVSQAIAQGRIGAITSAVASVAWWREQSYYDSAAWRGTKAFDGGVTMNQAIHTVDLLVWLLGEPDEVFAFTGCLAHEGIEVEDTSVAAIRFRSGALAVLHATTAAYPGLAVRLQIHGSQGSAIIHDDQLEFFGSALDGPGNRAATVVAPGEVRGAAKAPDSYVTGHVRQYEDIVDAIDSRRPPAVRVEDHLTALAVVTAVYRSAELHQPVRMADL